MKTFFATLQKEVAYCCFTESYLASNKPQISYGFGKVKLGKNEKLGLNVVPK